MKEISVMRAWLLIMETSPCRMKLSQNCLVRRKAKVLLQSTRQLMCQNWQKKKRKIKTLNLIRPVRMKMTAFQLDTWQLHNGPKMVCGIMHKSRMLIQMDHILSPSSTMATRKRYQCLRLSKMAMQFHKRFSRTTLMNMWLPTPGLLSLRCFVRRKATTLQSMCQKN